MDDEMPDYFDPDLPIIDERPDPRDEGFRFQRQGDALVIECDAEGGRYNVLHIVLDRDRLTALGLLP